MQYMSAPSARLNGRQSLAIIVTLDSVQLSYVLLALLLSDFDGYDMFFLALHLPHVFTVLLAYIVVHYSSGAVDVLRILVLFYVICFITDAFTLLARFGFLLHANAHTWLAQLVRLCIALLFIFIDVGGALFADLSRATAYTLTLRTDEQVLALAQRYQTTGEPKGVNLPV